VGGSTKAAIGFIRSISIYFAKALILSSI